MGDLVEIVEIKLQQQIEDLSKQHEETVAQLGVKHKTELVQLQNQISKITAAFQNKVLESDQLLHEQLQAAKLKHDAIMEKEVNLQKRLITDSYELRVQHTLNASERKMHKLELKYLEDLTTLRVIHEKEIATLRSQHQNDLRVIQNEEKLKHKDVHQLQQHYKSIIHDLQQQLNTLSRQKNNERKVSRQCSDSNLLLSSSVSHDGASEELKKCVERYHDLGSKYSYIVSVYEAVREENDVTKQRLLTAERELGILKSSSSAYVTSNLNLLSSPSIPSSSSAVSNKSLNNISAERTATPVRLSSPPLESLNGSHNSDVNHNSNNSDFNGSNNSNTIASVDAPSSSSSSSAAAVSSTVAYSPSLLIFSPSTAKETVFLDRSLSSAPFVSPRISNPAFFRGSKNNNSASTLLPVAHVTCGSGSSRSDKLFQSRIKKMLRSAGEGEAAWGRRSHTRANTPPKQQIVDTVSVAFGAAVPLSQNQSQPQQLSTQRHMTNSLPDSRSANRSNTRSHSTSSASVRSGLAVISHNHSYTSNSSSVSSKNLAVNKRGNAPSASVNSCSNSSFNDGSFSSRMLRSSSTSFHHI